MSDENLDTIAIDESAANVGEQPAPSVAEQDTPPAETDKAEPSDAPAATEAESAPDGTTDSTEEKAVHI